RAGSRRGLAPHRRGTCGGEPPTPRSRRRGCARQPGSLDRRGRRRGDVPERRLPRPCRRRRGVSRRRRRARRAGPSVRAHRAVAAVQLRRRGRGAGVTDRAALQQQVTLLELVDRVLNKGVVLTGDVTLSVAGVDLVYLGLRILLSSVATLERLE